MSTIKTTVSMASVMDFIKSIDDDTRRADSLKLLSMYEEATGEQSRMWGDSMVGYGQYHYKSEPQHSGR